MVVMGAGPRRAVPFLDRAEQRGTIGRYLASRRELDLPGLVCVHASAGLGSYSLAAEVYEDYRRAEGDCPYLEVQAATADGEALPLEDLLRQVLRGLEVPERELPSKDADLAQAYQLLSAGRRFVLLLKDVVDVAQVEPLIPKAAPSAVVLVTSRRALRRLAASNFMLVQLPQLPAPEARELLLASLGPTAAEIDDALLDELGELCGGHPLLIRLVAAHLLGRARVAEPLVNRIRQSRAALLELDVTQPVASSIKLAYDGLTTEFARVFRRVALLPGPDFTAEAAEVACGGDVTEMLDELVDASLLYYDDARGRYFFHALVREHAKLQEETEDRAEILERVVTWYLAEAARRDLALSGRWRIGDVFAEVENSGRPVPTRDEALAWFENEWRSVAACVAEAVNASRNDVAWQLCVALFKFLHMHGYTTAWLETHRIGIEAAELDSEAGFMQLANQRGAAWMEVGDGEKARADFEASLAVALRLRHHMGMQSNTEWLGKVDAKQRKYADAHRRYDESERMVDEAGANIPPGQAVRMRALLHLQHARAYLGEGNDAAAVASVRRALEFFDATAGERENTAKCQMVLGEAAEDALAGAEAYRTAAELFRADGLKRRQAEAWHGMGSRHPDPQAAREALEQARALYAEVGDPRAEEIDLG
ncbi:hypothetical protein A4R43_12950 [Amycolatopsis albispora]|uniref:Uncharacterized protein n=1 Tax=Amycolatopsis albispora TaxID=1804986 RepID=A0A344L5M4_9PSEU|nr:hypothetical protein A4R43_12950 [Amycolatopsis albispora]